jgi:hypothetical protein
MQYGTTHHPDGTVIQASTPVMEGGIPMGSTLGMIEVGVILQTYYADDPSWDDDNRAWAKGNIKGLFADVRIYGKVDKTLPRVPVFQRVHGIHDEDVYLPRAAKHDLGGGSLTIYPSESGQPTPAHRMDGDLCLVAFLGNTPTRPVILPFGPAHAASKRTLESSDGRVRRIRINGTMVEWGSGGNLTLDATGAAKADLDASGNEVSNSGTGGQVTIKTKDAAGAESSIVLDTSGGITVTDGAGDKLELTKATQKVKAVAGLLMELSAGTSLQVTAPTQTYTADAAVTMNSASITLTGAPAAAGGGPLPLVKYPTMAAAMATLMSAVDTWLGTYDPAKNPQAPTTFTQATLADWVTLNNAWKTALLEWAKPTTPTIVLKGG